MKLLAIVCPNGLGHFRRTVAILERLLDIHGPLQIELACQQWQVERLLQTVKFSNIWRQSVNYNFGITQDLVFWAESSQELSTTLLTRWVDKVRPSYIDSFDFVLSDNLTGILELRSDAVLMGSFLWSDVLESNFKQNPEVAGFIAHERNLLEVHRPPMLCVGPLATRGVLDRTRPIRCNFMFYSRFESYTPSAGAEPPWTVAVLSGARNKTCETIHHKLIEHLLREDKWRVSLPIETLQNSLLTADQRSSIDVFDFSQKAYRMCDVIIARPGMGTIHDTLSAGTPLLCSYEYNHELAHLASRLSALGLGVDFGSNLDGSALDRALESLLSTASLREQREARSKLGTGGLDQAAAWITGYIEGRTQVYTNSSDLTDPQI